MKNSWKSSFIAIVSVIAVGLGCNLFIDRGIDYFKGDNAAKMVDSVKGKIPKPFRIVEAVIESDEMRLQIVDPDNPRNVDEYRSRAGIVTGPNPVKLNALVDDPVQSSVPISEIDFAAVPKIVSAAVERVSLEGGVVRRMTFQRQFAISGSDAGSLGAPRWHVEIEGTRENASATANGAGEIIGLDLSRTSRAKDYTVLSKEELKRAQQALRSVVGEGQRVKDVTIRKSSVEISAVSGDGKNDLVGFTYGMNGVTKGMITTKAIPSKTEGYFALDDIDLTAAIEYLEKAKARLTLPNAEISHISFSRSIKSVMNLDDLRNQVSVSLQDGSDEGYVRFDLTDGSEMTAYKNGRELR